MNVTWLKHLSCVNKKIFMSSIWEKYSSCPFQIRLYEFEPNIPLTSRGNLAFLRKWSKRRKSRWLSLHIKHILSLQVDPALLLSLGFSEGRKAEPVLNFRTKFRYANVLKGSAIEKGCRIASKPHTLKLNKIRKI